MAGFGSVFSGAGPLGDLIPEQFRLALWGLFILTLIGAYFRIRNIEEKFFEVVYFYIGLCVLAYLLTGTMATVLFAGVLMTGVVLLGRLSARHSEFGSSSVQNLGDQESARSGSADARKRMFVIVKGEEALARSAHSEEARDEAEAAAREGEEALVEESVEGAVEEIPIEEMKMLGTEADLLTRARVHETKLAQLSESIANLDSLGEVDTKGKAVLLEVARQLGKEVDEWVEDENHGESAQIESWTGLEGARKVMDEATMKLKGFETANEKMEKKLGGLESKKLSKVRDKVKKRESNLHEIENLKVPPEDKEMHQQQVEVLERELRAFKDGLISLEGADQVIKGLLSTANAFIERVKAGVDYIKNQNGQWKSLDQKCSSFVSKEQQLWKDVEKVRRNLGSEIAGVLHDQMEGNLKTPEEVVSRVNAAVMNFFEAFLKYKQDFFEFGQQVVQQMLQASLATTAEMVRLKTASIASKRVNMQVRHGFEQLDILAARLLGDEGGVEGEELSKVMELDKLTDETLLKEASIEQNTAPRIQTEIQAAQAKNEEVLRDLEQEMQHVRETRTLLGETFKKALKMLEVKREELTRKIEEEAQSLARNAEEAAKVKAA